VNFTEVGTAAKQNDSSTPFDILLMSMRFSIVCLGTEEMMRVIRSVSSGENRAFRPWSLPQGKSTMNSKATCFLRKDHSAEISFDLQDSTNFDAKLLTRLGGDIGELKTLLAAAEATEAMRSGTERLLPKRLSMDATMYPQSTRKTEAARGLKLHSGCLGLPNNSPIFRQMRDSIPK